MARILLLYDSRGGLIEQLAHFIGEGVVAGGAELLRRRVDEASVEEWLACDALIVGSPNWSGITGKLKEWFDYSGDRWESGEFSGKLGAAFTAGYSRSGGIEATLLQLIHLLMAHGAIIVGLPWTNTMRVSGSYYGATAHGQVTPEDEAQARALGQRVAELAVRLAAPTEARP
jgi:NAD(P)H dehydrogenase (quinone)